MAAAGLGEDLLLANEVLDARRLGALATGRGSRWRSTRRRRSPRPPRGGVREVLVDVNVGLPRCGIAPERRRVARRRGPRGRARPCAA